MLENIFGHWKSTVAGLVLGFGQYLLTQGDTGFTWRSFLPAIATVIFGASLRNPSGNK